MERFGLIMLAIVAGLGIALHQTTPVSEPIAAPGLETPLSSDSIAAISPVAPDHDPTPAGPALTPQVPEAPLETFEDDADELQQILDRFALRHTGLSPREQARVAHVIIEEARAHALPADLVMGVIEVESAGYHLAESRVGALGLMQLMPATAQEIAQDRGIPWKGPETLFDPVVNVRLGTSYLRKLADRYSGDVDIALAAYNWGPGRIDRFLRRGTDLPSHYVQQVRSAVDQYATIPSARS
jgi:soluble lytic murein transglycosylase-like protein